MNFAATQSRPVTGSFQSIINGNLSITDQADTFADTFEDDFNGVVEVLVDVARADLRARARATEGWADIAEALDVSFDGEDFVYAVTDKDSLEIANALEYGTDEVAPTGFLRKIALSHTRQFKSIIDLFTAGVIPVA